MADGERASAADGRKEELIARILELQNTLHDLSQRVNSVKEENSRLKGENEVWLPPQLVITPFLTPPSPPLPSSGFKSVHRELDGQFRNVQVHRLELKHCQEMTTERMLL